MIRFGLIGNQIGYSKSKVIHESFGRMFEIDLTYDIFDVDIDQIKHIIHQVKTKEIKGLNVTKPYKAYVIKYVDLLTERAKHIGAINTIYLKDEMLIGDNTDYLGFKGLLEINDIKLNEKSVMILGSGGAAKACYAYLKDHNIQTIVATRNPFVAQEHFDQVIAYDMIKPLEVDVYIHATSLLNDVPISKDKVKHQMVIDLNYQPIITPMMKLSKKAYNGLDMLILQAFESFKLWTNKDLQLTDQMYQKIKDVIINE